MTGLISKKRDECVFHPTIAGAGAEYAIRLWKEGESQTGRQTVPGVAAAKVVHLGSGCEAQCATQGDGVTFDLPAGFKADANADVFKIVR